MCQHRGRKTELASWTPAFQGHHPADGGAPLPVARKPRIALRSEDRVTAVRILPCRVQHPDSSLAPTREEVSQWILVRTNSGQCAALLVVRELIRCGFHLTTIPSQITAVASRLIATASGISARANWMDAGLNRFDAKPSGLTAMPSGLNAISSRITTIFGARNTLTRHLRNAAYSANYLILRNSSS